MSFYGFGLFKEYQTRDCGKYAKKLGKILDFFPEDLSLTISKLDHISGASVVLYHKPTGKKIAWGHLMMMPGCCGLVVSTGSYVNPDYRNKGVGTIMHKIRKDIAGEAGFSCMICTDVMNNKPQQKILKNAKWKFVHKFLNRNTGNTVGIHITNVKDVDV